MKKERREALADGIRIDWLTGKDLTERAWDDFYAFYMDTGGRKWGRPYLNRQFFSLIGERMADDILLVMAKRQGRYIAGAINFIGGDALYGVRQMAKSDTAGAVATWLAGLRFSQCISRDVGLIGLLSARPAFTANLHLLSMAVEAGTVNAELQERVRTAIHELPAEGLDWQGTIKSEAWADEEGLKYLAKAQNFQETYKSFFGSAAPAQPPAQSDIAAFRTLMNEVLAAFQLSSAQAKGPLTEIAGKVKNMNASVQAIFPNYSKMNDLRSEVVSEREKLLRSLAGQRGK